MKKLKIGNVRFPNTCVITRVTGNVQDSEDSTTTLYSGSCRKELATQDTRHYRDRALTARWLISLPVTVDVTFGDTVAVEDGIGSLEAIISDWQPTNIPHENVSGVIVNGADVGGTATIGMHIYAVITKN